MSPPRVGIFATFGRGPTDERPGRWTPCALPAAVGNEVLGARGIGLGLDAGDYALLLVGGALAGGLWAAIGVGVGAVVRSQVPALIGICAWLLFVESLVVEGNSSVIEVGPGHRLAGCRRRRLAAVGRTIQYLSRPSRLYDHHPDVLRIIKAFLGDRPLTTSQLAAELDDVPAGSLYRHVARVTQAGILQVGANVGSAGR